MSKHTSAARMRARLTALDKKVARYSAEVLTHSERHEREILRDELEIRAGQHRRRAMAIIGSGVMFGASGR